MSDPASAFEGDRLAKVIARSGLCSRRDAELWIKEGRVAVNGKVIRTPAFNVTGKDKVKVDGQPLADRQGTRVWLYHKPAGLVVTEKDPEGRPTIFETLEEQGLPRVVSIGRLDINTEGLLLLTNDGGLKRVLELPATGWLRRYRVRAFGSITQPQLDALKEGIEVDGVNYGPIEATLEREQGSNVWLLVGLREGKNREVKNVLAALGLKVNRLIRVSFGPFQLSDLPIGGVEVVRARILREQLGKRLADEAGVDFDSQMPEPAAVAKARGPANPALRAARPGAEPAKQRKSMADRTERFRFIDRADRPQRAEDRPPAKDRPGSRFPRRPPRSEAPPERRGPPRKVYNEDGTETLFEPKSYGRPKRDAAASEGRPPFKRNSAERPKRDFGEKARGADQGPRKDFGNRPKRDFGSRPSSTAERGRGTSAAGGGVGREREGHGSRPKRDFGDREKRGYGDQTRAEFADRPKRPYGTRPALGGADRPKGSSGGKPRGDIADRPKRSYSAGGPAGDAADRPKRSFGNKPGGPPRTGPRPAGAADRPKRPRGSGPFGDRPRRPKPKT